MLMREAIEIINSDPKPTGYMVWFEYKKNGRFLGSDYFPDKGKGEQLISTEEEAWALATQFANKSKGKYTNIYVVDQDFMPVPGYKTCKIDNTL